MNWCYEEVEFLSVHLLRMMIDSNQMEFRCKWICTFSM